MFDYGRLSILNSPFKSCHEPNTVAKFWYFNFSVSPQSYIYKTAASNIRVREAPVRVCVLTLAGARWAVPRWSPAPLDGRGCGCWGPCSPGWQESAAGWTHPPSAGSHSLQSDGGHRRNKNDGEDNADSSQLWNIRVHSLGLQSFCWARTRAWERELLLYNPSPTDKENLPVKENSNKISEKDSQGHTKVCRRKIFTSN